MGKLEIQICLPPETLGALNKLTEALNKIAGKEIVINDPPATEPQAPKKAAKAPTAEPEETPAPTAEPEAPLTDDPDAQRAEMKDLIQRSVLTDCRDGIVALLQKYGVKRASAVPDEKIGDFLRDLKEVCAA